MNDITLTRNTLKSPILERIQSFYVVREDLFEGGTKRRILTRYLENKYCNEIVYASPRFGYGQLAVSMVGNDLGIKNTIFVPNGEKSEVTQRCEELGSDIQLVKMGYQSVLEKRARDYVSENEVDRIKIPFGFDDELMVDSVCEVASSLNIESPPQIWSSISSGVLSRGLQKAFPKSKVFGVQVGHKTSDRERGRAILIESKYKFTQKCKISERPPFPSNLYYDSKVWDVMKEQACEGSLFWNL